MSGLKCFVAGIANSYAENCGNFIQITFLFGLLSISNGCVMKFTLFLVKNMHQKAIDMVNKILINGNKGQE